MPISRNSSEQTLLILRAAQEMFCDGGLQAVTMEGVSSRTGVAKTTLYRRWKNKEQLALDSCLYAMREAAPIPSDGPFSERMRIHLRSAVRFLRGDHGDRLRQLIGASQANPSLRQGLQERFLTERRAQARAFLEDARNSGAVQYADIEAALDFMAGPLYHRLIMGHLRLSDTYADAHCDLLMKALSPHC